MNGPIAAAPKTSGTGSLPLVRSLLLTAQPGVVHGFSTRAGGVSTIYRPDGPGDLNLGFTPEDNPAHVRENRSRFFSAVGDGRFPHVVLLRQVHSAVIHLIGNPSQAAADPLRPATLEGDGAATNVPGILLAVQTADCVPVLVHDPRTKVVAAFHAGWRGTVARIVEAGIGTLCGVYGCGPETMVAAIGPSIGPDSYTVGEEVRHAFATSFAYAPQLFRERESTSANQPEWRLDLWEANRRQLLEAGLLPEHITVAAEDTADGSGRYFSHRADRGFSGRMMSAIGILP